MFSLDQLSQWVVAASGMFFVAVCSFGVNYIRGVGKCLMNLDRTMDKLLEREKFHMREHEEIDEAVKDHDGRLRTLEQIRIGH